MNHSAPSDVVSAPLNMSRSLSCLSGFGPLLALATMLNSTACATVATRRGPSSTKVVGTSPVVEPGDQVEPSVEQEGSEITITVKRVCRTREMLRIQTTTTFERYDSREPTAAKVELGLGITLGVLGGSVMAASHQLANTDAQNHGGTTGNATPYLVAGGLGLATGAIFLIAAAVDAGQSSGTEDRISMSTRQGSVKGVASCPTAIDLAPMPVSLQFGEQSYPVGETDSKGTLEVDLAEALPPAILRGGLPPREARLIVQFDGQPFVATDSGGALGIRLPWHAALEPIIFVQEGKAWATLDRTTCSSAASITACDAVQQFVNGYPNGRHVADARAILDQAEPKLRVLRDAEAARVAKEQHDAEVRAAKERAVAERAAQAEAARQRAADRRGCELIATAWPSMVAGGLIAHVLQNGPEAVVEVRMDVYNRAWSRMGLNGAEVLNTAIAGHVICERPSVKVVHVVGNDGTRVVTMDR